MIADTLRRAHLIDGVPWSQMAVIVRSVPRAAARLPRALAAAGVSGGLARNWRPCPRSPRRGRCSTVLAATAAGWTGNRRCAADRADRPLDPVSIVPARRTLNAPGATVPQTKSGDLLVEALTGQAPARPLPARGVPCWMRPLAATATG